VPADRDALRSIHGLALVAYRRGRLKQAVEFLDEERRFDPDDHQGARFLARDIAAGKRWSEKSSRS
jgi:hypothetical protein